MSSGSGSSVLQKGSDELYDHVCGPCENEGYMKEARKYCEVCSEFLCDHCIKHHRKLALLKKHKLVPAHTVSVIPSRCLSFYCGCSSNNETEHYCENHSDVICTQCKNEKHDKCRTTPIQQKCSGYKALKIDEILAKTNHLKDKYDRLKQKCSTNKKELVRSKDVCHSEIKAFRRELNDFLDKLEQKMLIELDACEDEENKLIDQQFVTLSKTLQMLDTDDKMLTEAKVDGKIQTMFAAEVRAKKTIRECKRRLADLEKAVANFRLSFEKNKKLADFPVNIKSLGTLNTQTKKADHRNKVVLLGKHVESRREVMVRSNNCYYVPAITDYALMPNGNIVICDSNNDRLKLFDNSWACQESLAIPNIRRMSVVDPNTVIVTVPSEKKLQYVQILPQLQLERNIDLDTECLGVCVSGTDIYMTCKTPKGPEIRVLGLDGTFKRHIPIERNSYPDNITVAPSREKIFYTDRKTQTITCMTVDGRIVYKYRDENLKDARGIYCDLEDNLFVCGQISNNVYAITADGKSCGKLLTVNDGLRWPECIAYRSSENELIIGCLNSDHSPVYKMTN